MASNSAEQSQCCDMAGLQTYEKFDAFYDKDSEIPCMFDVVMLKSGTILAADYKNFTLKAFDMKGNLLGDLYFEGGKNNEGTVRCIAMATDTTCYVTIPGQRLVAKVRIDETTSDNRKVVTLTANKIPTERRYHAIAHLSRKQCLVVGTTNKTTTAAGRTSRTGVVDLIDYDGNIIQSVDPDKATPFHIPINMAVTDRDEILVSDSGRNCIFLISDDLRITVISIDDRLEMRGVTSDDRGNILFCGESCHGIELVSASRIRRSLLPDNPLKEPLGIHFQSTVDGKWLVVSQLSGSIQIFKYLS